MPMPSDDVEILAVGQGARLDEVRALFREYEAELHGFTEYDKVLQLQGFEDELSSLPGDYAPPGGALFVALVNGVVAGCAALRPLAPDGAELKRLFVRPAFRGQSLGRRLIGMAMEHSSLVGASRLRLDTLSFMRSATRLYRAMGFVEIPSYLSRPTPGARCFEIALEPAPPLARMVEYQPAGKADFERLNREWLEEYFHVEAVDLKYFADPQGMIIDAGGTIVFVEEGGRRVGTCAVLREGTRYCLARMAVQADCRGKGYGQWLVTAAIDFARTRGASTIFLFSDEKLQDALRLYARMGFERRPFPGKTGYTRGDVYMELPSERLRASG